MRVTRFHWIYEGKLLLIISFRWLMVIVQWENKDSTVLWVWRDYSLLSSWFHSAKVESKVESIKTRCHSSKKWTFKRFTPRPEPRISPSTPHRARFNVRVHDGSIRLKLSDHRLGGNTCFQAPSKWNTKLLGRNTFWRVRRSHRFMPQSHGLM